MKKITIIFSVLLILGLVIGAYAFSAQLVRGADCCCKDSCPMKSKDKTAGSDKHSCCGDENCCKDGSCPMRSKDAAKTEKASGCPGCGDSCPLRSKGKTADKDKKEDSKEKTGQIQ